MTQAIQHFVTLREQYMKPNWIDMLIYRLYRWRWNKIFASNPAYRELFISYMKAFDTLDDGEQITVTITKTVK